MKKIISVLILASTPFCFAALTEAESDIVGTVVIPAAEVGSTCDACASNNTVWFSAKEGRVDVSADSSKTVDLGVHQTELTWYCGGTRERCANDKAFNRVRCERAGNGAITWTFYSS